MKFEQLPSALQTWLGTMHTQKFSQDEVLKALVDAKYDTRYAQDAVAAAWRQFPQQQTASLPVVAAVNDPAAALSRADSDAAGERSALSLHAESLSAQLVELPNSLDTSDRAVEMLFVMTSPRVVLFGDLLSGEECELLIEQSRTKLERSSVVNASTGAYDVHPHRTSSGTYFRRGENDLISRIERRIAELVDCPLEQGEPIQILHYQRGGEYKPHFDYFDPALPGNHDVLQQGGQRIATLIMYLNDVAAGGSTVFPEIGLDVLPRRGHAVYFAYCDDESRLDKRTLHGGSPVSGGEKWIATKWFRQRAYTGPGT